MTSAQQRLVNYLETHDGWTVAEESGGIWDLKTRETVASRSTIKAALKRGIIATAIRPDDPQSRWYHYYVLSGRPLPEGFKIVGNFI